MKRTYQYTHCILFICLLIGTIARAGSPIVLTIKDLSGKTNAAKLSFLSLSVRSRAEFVDVKPTMAVNSLKYVITDNGPVSFRFNERYFIGEPGDNIVFETDGRSMKITGQGAEKYQLVYLIDSLRKTIPLPANPSDNSVHSLADYLEWHNYTKRSLALVLPVIDQFESKISGYAFSFIKARFFDILIDNNSDKFATLTAIRKDFGLSNMDICNIYDSTYQPFVSRLFAYSSRYLAGSWKPVSNAVNRKFNFDFSSAAAGTQLSRRLAWLEEGKKQYVNEARESFIYKMLYKELVKDFGFIPEIEKALADYYAEPGYERYKAFMKEAVETYRRRLNAHGAPDFALVDQDGKVFSKEQFKGKLVLFDFWFSGCGGCVQMARVMKKLEKEFSQETNLAFVSVSIDANKDMWVKSIARQKYTSGGGLQLYTGGRGGDDSLIKKYAISGYPFMALMDPYGNGINVFPFPDPRNDDGNKLKELLNQQLAKMKDGPYLIKDKENTVKYEINGDAVSKEIVQQPSIQYTRDNNQPATVFLKHVISVEPSEFQRPSKLLALSDIEGNFTALKNLLQQNGVIDEQLNWTFGNGHLVFAGDMFDRGIQVTECLWLIYSLEEKAKASGGYVHFILGNHEVMNLHGNEKYAHEKYQQNAAKLNISLKDLYSESSELGKWLRSKNIIEKIGDLLFVHGGIGVEFMDSAKLNIDQINTLARPYYADKSVAYSKDVNTRMIFDGRYGPLWFRQYYDDKDKIYQMGNNASVTFMIRKPTMTHMDNILKHFSVSHIITGHTITGDTISVWYDNKVINTDIEHRKGKSEALLIEGSKFYRVNAEGKRWLLFDDKL